MRLLHPGGQHSAELLERKVNGFNVLVHIKKTKYADYVDDRAEISPSIASPCSLRP